MIVPEACSAPGAAAGNRAVTVTRPGTAACVTRDPAAPARAAKSVPAVGLRRAGARARPGGPDPGPGPVGPPEKSV
eukprot:756811-Hanusia_phi.AAC.3